MSIVSKSLVGTLTPSAVAVGGLRFEDADGIYADFIDVALTDTRSHLMMRLDADYISDLLRRKEP